MEKQLAFIFDLDGVIVDSTSLHIEVWERYLEPYGIDSGGIREKMHGKRNDEIVRELFGEGLGEAELHAHGAAKEVLYREMITPQLERKLVPGIREFLERYRDFPIGLASNAEPANVACVLDNAGLRSYFRAVVDGHQVRRPKPFPDVYLKAVELLGAPAGRCIVFEDSAPGVLAALSAGTRVIGLTTTCDELPGVELAVADFQDPELERWLRPQIARV